jgi:hypothetical protein
MPWFCFVYYSLSYEAKLCTSISPHLEWAPASAHHKMRDKNLLCVSENIGMSPEGAFKGGRPRSFEVVQLCLL